MLSFEEILKMRSTDFEAPKAIPPGAYLGIVDGEPKQIQSPEKGTKGFQFDIRLIQPYAPADGGPNEEDLAAAGGCANKMLNNKFYLSENNSFFIFGFLVDHLGVDNPLDANGKPVKDLIQLISEARGKQVGAKVKHIVTKGASPRIMAVLEGTFKAHA